MLLVLGAHLVQFLRALIDILDEVTGIDTQEAHAGEFVLNFARS